MTILIEEKIATLVCYLKVKLDERDWHGGFRIAQTISAFWKAKMAGEKRTLVLLDWPKTIAKN
jgi:hypothetical protein